MVGNNWIPLRRNVRHRATAATLATLLRESGWEPSSLDEHPGTNKLLKAIRVTHLDLTREFFAAGGGNLETVDNQLTYLMTMTNGDLSHVRQFVEDLERDEDLLNELANRRERRRIVHQNQELGNRIEDFVKESLKSQGFFVTRTGIGSDFLIEYDLIEEDTEMGFELTRHDQTWLVEVKATRDEIVRMTVTQAKTAVQKGEEFLLCVVPVGGDISASDKDSLRANMRFLQNIGPRVKRVCEDLNTLEDLQEDLTHDNTDIQLEVGSGTARIRVNETVWGEGYCLKDLSERLK